MKRSQLILISLLLLLSSCPIAHDCTFRSIDLRFQIIQDNPDIAGVKVQIYRNGRFEDVVAVDGVYCVATGNLSHGYMTILGMKTNIHDPLEYKILRIKWPLIGQRDLSINDIDALPSEFLDNQKIGLLDQASFLKIEVREN